jgi:hypothetical protein
MPFVTGTLFVIVAKCASGGIEGRGFLLQIKLDGVNVVRDRQAGDFVIEPALKGKLCRLGGCHLDAQPQAEQRED